jgi:hypothetical protein
MGAFHPFDETLHAWLPELLVAPQVFLTADPCLFGLAVGADGGQCEQGAELVEVDRPSLVNEIARRCRSAEPAPSCLPDRSYHLQLER